MPPIADIVISLLLIFAGIFGFVGSVGLVKLNDTMRRLHAPTKATTLGIGGVLIASMIFSAVYLDTISVHELLITLFLFVTAPITANFIAKAYLHRNVERGELPPSNQDCGWAIYDSVPTERKPIDTK